MPGTTGTNGPDIRSIAPRVLAIASFDAFVDGLFSSNPTGTLRADAASLTALTKGRLAAAFQVEDDNPLAGLDGRVGLMNRLGAALAGTPELFGTTPTRIGHLYDHLKAQGPGRNP